MAKQANMGFFTMDMIHQVVKLKDLEQARKIATDAIEAAAKSAKPENVRKASSMVHNAKTVDKLALAMSNFMLSHDNLKVI